MKEKLKSVIEDMENHIEREQKLISRYTKDFKEYAETYTPEEIVMFLPGKIRELEEAISRRTKYADQLDMLKFIETNN